jgi:hypothetical protein
MAFIHIAPFTEEKTRERELWATLARQSRRALSEGEARRMRFDAMSAVKSQPEVPVVSGVRFPLTLFPACAGRGLRGRGARVDELNAPSAEELIALLVAHWEVSAKVMGPKRCEKYGIGAERDFLETAIKVIPIRAGHAPGLRRTAYKGQVEAAERLAEVCRRCGGCPWASR